MAGPKGSKYYDVFLRYQISLETLDDEKILDSEGFGLLDAVDKKGSLAAAASETGMSYRKAWGIVRDLEEKLGFNLVCKSRGGAEGGHTYLSDEGSKLTKAYNELTEQFNTSMKEVTRKFFWSINEKPGKTEEEKK